MGLFHAFQTHQASQLLQQRLQPREILVFWFMEMDGNGGGFDGVLRRGPWVVLIFSSWLGTLFGRDFGDSCSMKSFEDQK